MKEPKVLVDFVDGEFVVNGKRTTVWFVGGSGTLYGTGNVPLITFEAFRELVKTWIAIAHV